MNELYDLIIRCQVTNRAKNEEEHQKTYNTWQQEFFHYASLHIKSAGAGFTGLAHGRNYQKLGKRRIPTY